MKERRVTYIDTRKGEVIFAQKRRFQDANKMEKYYVSMNWSWGWDSHRRGSLISVSEDVGGLLGVV